MLCSDVPIVFGNMRYMPLALDSRAEACKMMQRGISTVQLRRKGPDCWSDIVVHIDIGDSLSKYGKAYLPA
jgi:hypothetical protein